MVGHSSLSSPSILQPSASYFLVNCLKHVLVQWPGMLENKKYFMIILEISTNQYIYTHLRLPHEWL